jgi:hypothetical protein
MLGPIRLTKMKALHDPRDMSGMSQLTPDGGRLQIFGKPRHITKPISGAHLTQRVKTMHRGAGRRKHGHPIAASPLELHDRACRA